MCRLVTILVVAVWIISAPAARAATVSWTNATGGSWSLGSNWSTNAPPGNGDDVLITLNGTYTVTLDTAATVGSFTLGGAGGTQTFALASVLTLNGTGTVGAGGVVNLTGTLDGSGTLTVNRTMSWTGSGTMSGSGTTSIGSGGTLNVSGAGTKSLSRTLSNAGSLNIADHLSFNGGTLVNSGLAEVLNDSSFFLAGGTTAISNSGTLSKIGGSGITSCTVPLSNTGSLQVHSGTFHLGSSFTQSSGSTRVDSATLSAVSTVTFSGGTLSGYGSVAANVTNNGAEVVPGESGAGVLNITGDYVQGSGGSLHIELGGTTAGTQYDQLRVSGSATLAGTLNITEINAFSPAAGNTFRVMTFGSRSGTFNTITGLVLGGGKTLDPTYGAADLTLLTIAAAALPTATVSGSATICQGASAQIQAVLTGIPPWDLMWSDGFPQSGVAASPATRSVSPVTTTTYTVTNVASASGSASGTGSAVITVNPRPIAVASGSAAICPGASRPLSGSGGAACSWAPLSGLSSATSCSPTASPSATTTYTLTVIDANSCVSTNGPTVTVSVNPAVATPTIAAPSSAAPNQVGLTASVTANAGSTYQWGIANGTITSGTNGSSIAFTAAASGTLTLTVVETSAAGCASAQASKSIPITGGLPTATVSGSASICLGASAQIQAALSGTPPWIVVWSDGVTQTNVASSPAVRSVSPTTSTTYTVTSVSNADGSSAGTGSAVITVNPRPTAVLSSSVTICQGASSPLSGSGGTSCAWSPSSGLSSATSCSPTASPAATTTYTLTVTDANGCVSTNGPTVTVTVSPVPSTPVITAPNSATPNQAGLTASVTANAGSTYQWGIANGTITSGEGGSSITFTAAASGTLTLAVVETSAAGCASAQASKSIPITGEVPTATVSGSTSICPGASAQLQAALGGTPPWTVVWSDGVTQTNIASSPAVRSVSPTTTTTYTVTSVSNADGSSAGTGSAVITVNPRPTAVVSSSVTICQGASSPLSGSGGTSCSWAPSSGLSSATSCSPTASPAATTTYTLSVTDANGCVSANGPTVTVTIRPTPSTPIISAPNSATPNEAGMTASVTANSGSTYQWGITNGAITSGPSGSFVTFTAAASGTITLTVVETSAAGCASAQASKSVPITGGIPTATVTGSASLCLGASAQLQAVLSGTPPWTVVWSDSVTQANVASSPAVRSVSPTTTTTYSVTSVSNADGSSAGTGSAVITVNPKPVTPAVDGPSSASPNETGLAARVTATAGSTYQWTITNGAITAGATTSSITFTAGSLGTVVLRVIETSAAGCASDEGTLRVNILTPCPTPGAPVLSSTSTTLVAGQSVAVAWTEPTDFANGSYVLETSRDGFTSATRNIRTPDTSAVIPTDVSANDFDLSARVSAISSCGSGGPTSNVVKIRASATPARFALTQAAPSWTVSRGGTPPGGLAIFRNIGAVSGRLTIDGTGGFYTFDPPAFDLAPGAEASVTLTATAAAVSSEGVFTGVLTARAGTDQLASPVSLTVVPRLDASGAKVRATVGSVTFSALAGGSPGSASVDLVVSPGGPTAVYLSPTIGPGGSWLTISNDLASPVPPSGRVSLTLSVDRSKRSTQDGAPPLRTLLRITPVGGDPVNDSAVVEVLDVETLAVVSGAGDRGGTSVARALLAPPPGGSSFIIPTTVKAAGASGGQVFTSDGWLRNLSAAEVSADVFFTPQDANGLSDPGVKKANLRLGAGGTTRLSDLLSTIFQTDGTGQVEVRSATPTALSLRATADSLAGGDPASRFGSEIPVVSYGSGVGLSDGELVVPGIDDDGSNRSNLILAETTGAGATVRVSLNDTGGNALGSLTRELPPYGKVQLNRLVALVLGDKPLSGGWAGVTVTAGFGKVVALTTVIDNRSGSFSAILGRSTRTAAAVGRRPQAALPVRFVIPSCARTLGAFNTLFTTSLSLVNGVASPASLTLTYEYIDQDDGNAIRSVQKAITIPPRGAMQKSVGNDVIANLFGVTHRSYGSILMDGDVGKVVAVAALSAQVDPNDAAKGLKSSPVNAMYLTAPEVMGSGESERRFAGVEKSVQRRSNLILRELLGKSCRVTVRLYSAAGPRLGERTFDLGPSEYLQINDVFGENGVGLGEGPFQNVEVTAEVTSGDGRVVALATVNDNISRNPEVFVLQLPAPSSSGIGF